MERKLQRPGFMAEISTQVAYDRWLQRKAEAHIIRDRKRGNEIGTVSSYKQAIHRAVLGSEGRDFYTGEMLNWTLISTYDNEQSKAGRTIYKLDFALLPSVDHYGNGRCAGDFAFAPGARTMPRATLGTRRSSLFVSEWSTITPLG